MLMLLFWILVPLLVSASGITEWQKPYPNAPGLSNCGRGRKGLYYGSAFTFHMKGDWRYYFTDYFPTDSHCWSGRQTPLSLGALYEMGQRIAPPRVEITSNIKANSRVSKPRNRPISFMITVPLDTEAEGPLIIEPEPQWKLFHYMDTSIDIIWTKSKEPGKDLNITSIEMHLNSTTSVKTAGAPIALDTPYINLPSDLYDFVFAITQPQRVDMGRGMQPIDLVDCTSIFRFPNLVLEFEGGTNKLIVKPEQYVLRVNNALGGQFKGKCVLLMARGGDFAVGWAALRGRSVWFDWANARTGFTV